MSSLAYLQKTIATQTEQINVLVCDRNWLEQQNNIKRVSVNRLNEKMSEYQRYLHHREAVAVELDKVWSAA